MLASPHGPTCHLGTTSCFSEVGAGGVGALGQLARTVRARAEAGEADSYTVKLLQAGIGRIAQKVGEEGVEVALAAQSVDNRELVSEAADLLFHLALLLRARDLSLDAVGAELAARHRARS
jgi:phosphoribosyl-ATP pyrophosphohydrolase/phosphoribosyl-AMP cyclohydrolase